MNAITHSTTLKMFNQPLRNREQSEQNPVGLPQGVVQPIVADLDRHVSSLFILFHQYQKHHWLVDGPNHRDLHLFFEDCYKEIHADCDALAERLTVLGGLPTCSPVAQGHLSYLVHEPEGEYPLTEMLAHDLDAEQTALPHLRQTVVLAQQSEDFSTAELVKKVLSRAEIRAHHLDHYLAVPSPAR